MGIPSSTSPSTLPIFPLLSFPILLHKGWKRSLDIKHHVYPELNNSFGMVKDTPRLSLIRFPHLHLYCKKWFCKIDATFQYLRYATRSLQNSWTHGESFSSCLRYHPQFNTVVLLWFFYKIQQNLTHFRILHIYWLTCSPSPCVMCVMLVMLVNKSL